MAQLCISGSGSLTEVKMLARVIVTQRLGDLLSRWLTHTVSKLMLMVMEGFNSYPHWSLFMNAWVSLQHVSRVVLVQVCPSTSNPRKRARRKLSFLWLTLGRHKASPLHIRSIRRESLSPAYIHKEFWLQYLLWTCKFQHILTWSYVSFSLEYINIMI